MPALLVTGGLGFIGAAYVELLRDTRPPDWHIVVLDGHFYAADLQRLSPEARADPTVHVLKSNLLSWSRLLREMERWDVREVVHFAAYSDVSASFENPLEFSADNLLGTQTLLECCRLRPAVSRILVASTDEVYGESELGAAAAPFDEQAPMRPSNPYAASKAAADLMALTYARCFGLPVVVSRGNNVVGPGQHPEKLVPAVAARLGAGEPALVEGDGLQTRGFLHVRDAARAMETLRVCGRVGEAYNVGGEGELSVLDVVRVALAQLRGGGELAGWVRHVPDRPCQDRRYFVDSAKLRALGWRPRFSSVEAVRLALAGE